MQLGMKTKERVLKLATGIAVEKDRTKFLNLIEELHQVLGEQETPSSCRHANETPHGYKETPRRSSQQNSAE